MPEADVSLATKLSARDAKFTDQVLGNIVDAAIAVADASGGATDALLTLDIYDLNGEPLAAVCVVRISASDTAYLGLQDPNANITLGTVTKGSVLAAAAAAGAWVVKTDANGQFACTATNAADETVQFSVDTAIGGVDALPRGVLVRGCIPDAATWSA